MNLFLDCFAAHASGADADRLFVRTVDDSPLNLWAPGDPIPMQAVRLLIGAAPSSAFDMRLLDVVVEAMGRGPSALPTVDVFNAAHCSRPDEVRRYVPTLREATPTPVAGVWFGGQLTWYGQGHAALDQVARMFRSTAEQIVEQVRRWTQTRAASLRA